MTSISGLGFENVDASVDPQAGVSYLDAVTALDAARAYKRQTFALMDIRPGDSVLDVGCGTGDDLRELAAFVGPTGRVVGVDASQTMLEQARVRTEGLPVECRLGDAHQLEFPDNTFSACRCDRVLQHLQQPERAIAEIVRVARPGASIVLIEPDWDSMVVDAGDMLLTRRMREIGIERHRNGTIGRRLFGLCNQAGLREVNVTGLPAIFTDWDQAKRLFGLAEAADAAVKQGAASEAEAAAWLRDLEDRATAGTFFSALLAFIVSARKPSP